MKGKDMKILLVNKFLYPRGGQETYILKVGKQLEKMGHEVQYFGMYDAKEFRRQSIWSIYIEYGIA